MDYGVHSKMVLHGIARCVCYGFRQDTKKQRGTELALIELLCVCVVANDRTGLLLTQKAAGL